MIRIISDLMRYVEEGREVAKTWTLFYIFGLKTDGQEKERNGERKEKLFLKPELEITSFAAL